MFSNLGSALESGTVNLNSPAPEVNLLGFDLTQIGDFHTAALVIPFVGLALLAAGFAVLTAARVYIRTASPVPLALFFAVMLVSTQVMWSKSMLLSNLS